jgi:hypothetical protein
MKPIEPHDQRHLEAAEGWIELGNHLEANEELENITPEHRAHPAVLEVRTNTKRVLYMLGYVLA